MCEKQGDDVPIYPTFTLMYASNKAQAPAYHFGIHKEDFVNKPEAYELRLRRFRKFHEKDKKKEADLADPVPPTNEVPLSSLQPNGMEKDDQNAIDEKMDNLMVTVVGDQKDLFNVEHQGMCIFCQDDQACIVFQPCQHSVLCERCFLNGRCRKFCPACRTTLVSTSKPEKVKLVRPRIFSAYAMGEF